MPSIENKTPLSRDQNKLLLSEALKSFIRITLVLTLVNALVIWMVVRLLGEAELQKHESSAFASIKIAQNLATHHFETAISELRFLADSDSVKAFAEKTESSLEPVAQLFFNLAATHNLYDHVRLIDVQGMEIVRVDRQNGEVKIIEPSNLQNKSNRYYFTETARLKRNEIYISPIDLNVENDKIQIPHKPMIRFGKPVFNSSGEFRGVILLNYLGSILMDQFRQQMDLLPSEAVLLNAEGYWLSEPTNTKEWGFMFESGHTFGTEEPDLWREIARQQEGIIENADGQFIYSTIELAPGLRPDDMQHYIDDWKVVIAKRHTGWLVNLSHLEYLFPLLIAYPIGLFLIWKWSRASAGQKLAENDLRHLNQNLEIKVGERTRELEATERATIYSLASLAETRDNETGQHIRRTQHYVRVLALELLANKEFTEQLTPETIDLIFKSAPLHDIGKVGIPDNVLLKKGSLSDKELEIMQSHAEVGSNALDKAIASLSDDLHVDSDRTFLKHAKDIARHHHERWDGKGYPDKLKGDEIPLSARLMALADVYDALVSKRSYKPAFDRQKTERIILEESEGQFDPRIVAAFDRVRNQFWAIRGEFQDKPI